MIEVNSRVGTVGDNKNKIYRCHTLVFMFRITVVQTIQGD